MSGHLHRRRPEHVLHVRGGVQSGQPQKNRINKKARALRAGRDAKENEEDYFDPSCERQLESGALVRQALWEAHMKSPTAELEEALKRTEDGAGRAQSFAVGGSET